MWDADASLVCIGTSRYLVSVWPSTETVASCRPTCMGPRWNSALPRSKPSPSPLALTNAWHTPTASCLVSCGSCVHHRANNQVRPLAGSANAWRLDVAACLTSLRLQNFWNMPIWAAKSPAESTQSHCMGTANDCVCLYTMQSMAAVQRCAQHIFLLHSW